MLKPKTIPQVLAQANTDGVTSTMLLTSEGSLLAFAGENEKQGKVTAAIACNVWLMQEKNGKAYFDNDSMNTLIFHNEKGKVAVVRIAKVLLCLCAKETVGLGILRAKINALVKHLEEPLRQLMVKD